MHWISFTKLYPKREKDNKDVSVTVLVGDGNVIEIGYIDYQRNRELYIWDHGSDDWEKSEIAYDKWCYIPDYWEDRAEKIVPIDGD